MKTTTLLGVAVVKWGGWRQVYAPTTTTWLLHHPPRRRLSQGLLPAPDHNSRPDWLHKILYSSYLHLHIPPRTTGVEGRRRVEAPPSTIATLPVSATLLLRPPHVDKDDELTPTTTTDPQEEEEGTLRYPYALFTEPFVEEKQPPPPKYRSEGERLQGLSLHHLLSSSPNDPNEEEEEGVGSYNNGWTGTADPTLPFSSIPCGGCGAILQASDTSLPGYMASERFKMQSAKELRGELCLRCSSLRTHTSALRVSVSPQHYPRVLNTIQNKFAMVILLVDLTDFPCSIWPGIAHIIGTRRPVFLVGNKVDLLPRDSDKYLNHIKDSLVKAAQDSGLHETNIVHTALISATTGFGVEHLITKIYQDWENKGDIYIMGCTNVGKSSLFNALVQSDMCKVHVVDRIQRATVSQWPGTTLNLLKFPVMSNDSWRVAERNARLKSESEALKAEEKSRALFLKETKNSEHALLKGHIGRTFLSKDREDSAKAPMVVRDVFNVNPYTKYPPNISKPGDWDPSDPQIQGTWCFDTPGTVNENQILDILTLSELKKTIPTKLIEPRTFFIKEGMTMFVGGFARIDFVEGLKPIRYTLFTSDLVPVTIVLTEDAEDVYDQALGSPVFAIPSGSEERLREFPKLKSAKFQVTGMGHDCSCCDLVLSSAGWVAVTAGMDKECKLTVHTPNGKGIFLRRPALLPYAVNYKGKRIRHTPAYLQHRVFVPDYKGKMY